MDSWKKKVVFADDTMLLNYCIKLWVLLDYGYVGKWSSNFKIRYEL